eukprot:CFRG7582T1
MPCARVCMGNNRLYTTGVDETSTKAASEHSDSSIASTFAPNPESKNLEAFITQLDGEICGLTNLSDYIFAAPPRQDIIHRVVVWQLARRRSGTAQVKGRSQVKGSTKKIRPQKGTGGARHGAASAPQFRSGGVVHGPTNMRNYDYALPKKVRALGLRAALTIKYMQGDLSIVNAVKTATHKTAPIAKQLWKRGHSKESTVLVVCGMEMSTELQKATLNIPYARFTAVNGLNVYDIMSHKHLVLSLEAVDYLENFRFPLEKRF